MYWDDKATKLDSLSSLEKIKLVCNRFHKIALQMRNRYGKKPPLIINDEYDVQYLFGSLLALYFDDIEPEPINSSFAGSSSRADFLLKPEETIIEIKKTREGLNHKKIGEELILDIQKYQTNPDCRTLICFVYDPDEFIRNPGRLEKDLEKTTEKIEVKVFIRSS